MRVMLLSSFEEFFDPLIAVLIAVVSHQSSDVLVLILTPI